MKPRSGRVRYGDPLVERLPLEELVSLAERRLVESRVVERAARSSLYRERWAAAGVDARAVRSYQDLRAIPYTCSADLRSALQTHPAGDLVCSEDVRLWVSTSGTTGKAKWIPRSDKDLAISRELGLRARRLPTGGPVDLPDGMTSLGLTAPAPFVTDSSAAVSAVDMMLLGLPGEMIVLNYTEAADALLFALIRKPDVFLAFPSIAMRMAEGISENAPRLAREMLRQRFTAPHLLAYLVSRIKTVRVRDLVRFRWGGFAGEPLAPYRQAIRAAYGFDPGEFYAFSEFLGTMGDCYLHQGLHLWADQIIAEVIPEAELEREEASPGLPPSAVPLWKAPPGLRGDLVVTNFADALPLVRYRTSDLIEVVSTEPCGCGRTHPRIRVLHRVDDFVNLGIVRFSIYELAACLEQVPGLRRWQLLIRRQGYKPLGIVRAEPLIPPTDPESWKALILEQVRSLDAIRLGEENQLIAPVAVEMVVAGEDRRTTSGKLRLVVYED
ncbi:MAG: hypothetical protein WCP98_03730 [Actinomycetes bacterium]